MMAKIIHISPVEIDLPMEMRQLRVAAYCRVSTEQEEQDSSIELQEVHYRQLVEGNPNWTNAGIFSERASGLNLKERPAFIKMMGKCRKRQIDLILTKSMSRFGRNTLDKLRHCENFVRWGLMYILIVKIYGCMTSSLKH